MAQTLLAAVIALALGGAIGALMAFARTRPSRGWTVLAGVGAVAGVASAAQLDHGGPVTVGVYVLGGLAGLLLAARTDDHLPVVTADVEADTTR